MFFVTKKEFARAVTAGESWDKRLEGVVYQVHCLEQQSRNHAAMIAMQEKRIAELEAKVKKLEDESTMPARVSMFDVLTDSASENAPSMSVKSVLQGVLSRMGLQVRGTPANVRLEPSMQAVRVTGSLVPQDVTATLGDYVKKPAPKKKGARRG